ncbi:M23 family metallopeptidase [Microbacterium sp. ASV81]|uniref:Peptidoglycan DD-metalloendopeptidase family protein n=1 Tax=Microbacterium capsulatum TaxID=3041921 RepID=A0ABU0XBS5_9MICO|nr:peptidoglycan DD-metalloendopeptidase family protein [Microbacterium sp. ASV81]MDQ4212567.1 peptidoglycan DD-metalloendopeptidase family protein [Microbacterium sp. ASV81]
MVAAQAALPLAVEPAAPTVADLPLFAETPRVAEAPVVPMTETRVPSSTTEVPTTASTDDSHTRPATARGRGRTPSKRRSTATRPNARAPRPNAGQRRVLGRVGRTGGTVLAITALVCGTTLPAMALVNANGAHASATNASADIRAQSFTAGKGILPEVHVNGTYTATTPTELQAMQAATAAAQRTGVASIAKPGQVIYPMSAGSYTLTDGFGAARTGRTHMGQDFAASIGTPIYAAADGCVSMSQDSYGGYGVTVQLEHPALSGRQSVSTLYGHMDYGSRAVKVGECVTAGQFLGRVGNTGYTVGSCLHFEVHLNDSPIDPLSWLEANVF